MKQTLLITKLFLLFIVGTLFNSCSQKDEPTPVPKNEVEFNDQTHVFKVGFFHDWGLIGYSYAGVYSHRTFNIEQADGILELDDAGRYKSLGDSKIILYVGLKVADLEATFPADTFQYIPDTRDSEFIKMVKGKSYISGGWCWYDKNKDGKTDEYDESTQIAGGNVKISGTATNAIIQYDLQFKDGKTLKGTYIGNLKKY